MIPFPLWGGVVGGVGRISTNVKRSLMTLSGSRRKIVNDKDSTSRPPSLPSPTRGEGLQH
jgi:hypothetical protein